MKCIRCGHDSKFSERPGKKCPRCGGAFAFEPRAGDRFTDQGFQTAIDAVSANGRLRWGVEHLYYEICRRYGTRAGCTAFIVIAVLGVFLAIVLGPFVALALGMKLLLFPRVATFLVVVVVAGAIWLAWTRKRSRKPVLIPIERFDSLWALWTRTHGMPKGVIVRQPTVPAASVPARKEADVGDYSFDRAVICDRARTADLLLANNFHFEHNCAVLSIDGYPPGPFATVRAMLKRNPRLQVYVLHDATPAGCELALKLSKDRDWFTSPLHITDVGLRPVHAARFAELCLPPRHGLASARESVTELEAQWLQRHALELAVFRPEYILKQVYAAMTRKQGKDGSDGSGGSGSGESSVSNDTAAFSGEGGESGGGGADDSFG
jgi:uncharacterized membrane protein YgcG